ncbi:MAG: recombinase [Chloroflexi bacterium]|nr:recombinase [Chloroflexota bacterium]
MPRRSGRGRMHDDPLGPSLGADALDEELHGLWDLDTVTLTSVGIDVGTATSQVLFSRLILKRMGAELSSRFVVVSRDILHLSPVHLTPFTPGRERIDDRALGGLVDEAYSAAGLRPDDVDTGAIILTGEAIRRDNARAIADLFAEQRGDFVCATAGHHFEALLAAHGSGTIALTEGNPRRLLNIDIGGGTTKLAVVERGRVTQTAALHIGGRLLATDADGRIALLEPGGEAIARKAGFSWREGDRVTPEQIDTMAAWMGDAILSAVRDDAPPEDVRNLFVTPPLTPSRDYDGVVFSGGVGEYVYGKERESFGDLGQSLGRALRDRTADGSFPWPLLPARECIRATVMGASQYSVQVSGNTIYASDSVALLPQRNLQVLRPACDLFGPIDPQAVARAVQDHFTRFDLEEGESNVALVFQWQGDASYQRLEAFVDGLVRAIPRTLASDRPVVLVFDQDVAGTVGACLKDEHRAARLRLHRHRPGPRAVRHRARDHQVARVPAIGHRCFSREAGPRTR